MKIHLLVPTALALFLFSCNEPEEIQIPPIDITGYWINQLHQDSIVSYDKSAALGENQYCFGLQSNGVFVERKNAGFCGTPPISYADYDGTWTLDEDSLLHISVPYWGGISNYKWKVELLESDKLTIKELESEYISDN